MGLSPASWENCCATHSSSIYSYSSYDYAVFYRESAALCVIMALGNHQFTNPMKTLLSKASRRREAKALTRHRNRPTPSPLTPRHRGPVLSRPRREAHVLTLAPLLVCTRVYVLGQIFSKDFLETLSAGNNGPSPDSPVGGRPPSWRSLPSSQGSWQVAPSKGSAFAFGCPASQPASCHRLN